VTLTKDQVTFAKMFTARMAAADPGELAGQIGVPVADWARRCHEISLKLLRTEAFGPGRVARGTCRGVRGQHSWIVVGDDCYDKDAVIVDPTLWSYVPGVETIWVGFSRTHGHRPHGAGFVWEHGRPDRPTGPAIKLTPKFVFSEEARRYLRLLGPLDRRGWSVVAHSPVGGWPAGEIFAAMDDTPELSSLVPIDILGMTTDRNPSNLYR
jgi:hypothetical protein